MRVVLILLCVLGCSKDVHVTFPAAPDAPTGRLVLLLSRPASDVTVAINGVLVVDDKHTRRVTIDRLPVGNAEVMLTANGSDKQFRIWVDDTRPTSVPLGVPDQGIGFLKSIFGTLISLVAYSLLR